MPKQSTDFLLQLISSLTSAEKRHFRLFVSRKQNAEEMLFMQLFNYLEREKEYNESRILKQIPKIKVSQLSNLKANLYKQILTSIRHVERNNLLDISIRENLDFARILYNKGLYKASLDLLDKTKKIAMSQQLHGMALDLIELEKHIESQHITGSMYPKAEQLTEETKMLLRKAASTHELSSLSLSLYGLYLKYGYAKKAEDYEILKEYFERALSQIDIQKPEFYQKVFLYQSYVWFYNMLQDFANNYKYAAKWVDLFHEYPEMIEQEASLYLKALHNVLNSLFMLQRYDKFLSMYEELLVFKENHPKALCENVESLYNLFKYIHGINQFYLTGRYDEGVKFIPDLEAILENNQHNWDLHRVLLFDYKIACIYFGNGDLEKTIYYLNKITNQVYPNFREDIQCFARILNLIAHFDLGNRILVSYQVKSVYRFLGKMDELQKVLEEIFKFLKRTPGILESELKQEFTVLKERLEKLQGDTLERRPFLYLDIISWLESKIENRPIQEIIQAKLKSSSELKQII